jgi:hypothetical protein
MGLPAFRTLNDCEAARGAAEEIVANIEFCGRGQEEISPMRDFRCGPAVPHFANARMRARAE